MGKCLSILHKIYNAMKSKGSEPDWFNPHNIIINIIGDLSLHYVSMKYKLKSRASQEKL